MEPAGERAMPMRAVTWARSEIQRRAPSAAPGYLDAIRAATIAEDDETITIDVHHPAWRGPQPRAGSDCVRPRRGGRAPDGVIASRLAVCGACEWAYNDACWIAKRASSLRPAPHIQTITRGNAAQCPDGKW